ncbi:MAG: hypothetical protein CMN28_15255 [Salinisphaeraceae bacterium]|nr:hypothetical protein [Salinisphaeraceae bacterium]
MDILELILGVPLWIKVAALVAAAWLLLPARSGARCALEGERREKARRKAARPQDRKNAAATTRARPPG